MKQDALILAAIFAPLETMVTVPSLAGMGGTPSSHFTMVGSRSACNFELA